jgi:hypothetical protein
VKLPDDFEVTPLQYVDKSARSAAMMDEGRREWRRSGRPGFPARFWLAVALAVVGVLLLAAQNSTVVVPEMNSYTVVDQRTIAVKVGVAPCSWTRVTSVAETPTEVRVKVETLPCPIPAPGTAALAVHELTVLLAADLGARIVEDANGQAVPLQ